MTRSLSDLQPDFRTKADDLIAALEMKGITMVPFFTARSPLEQAKLWRQSRSKKDIEYQVEHLRKVGANYIADCIEAVGPQFGRWATNAVPGNSWHQHGLAMDCYWLLNGSAEWSSSRQFNGVNGYAEYAKEAIKAGLEAGYYWKSRDAVHIQGPQYGSPMSAGMGWLEIDGKMKERWK